MKQSMVVFENWYCAASHVIRQKLNKTRIVESDMYLDGYVQTEYNAFKAAFNSQQAIIDRLMLEYCPKEMTQLQMSEWENSQVSLIESINRE